MTRPEKGDAMTICYPKQNIASPSLFAAPAELQSPVEKISLRASGSSKRGETSAEAAASYMAALSPRERQVFELVLAGYPNKIIAADLGISQRTVENHRAALMKKTKARSVPELMRLSLAAKWFSAADPLAVGDEWNFLLDVEPIMAVGRAMFEHAPAAMIMVDHTCGILHVNPAGEQLFGYLEADLLGRPIEILLPVALREHHKQLRDGFLQAPTTRPMAAGRRLTARHADGHEISVDVGLRPLVAGGRPEIVLLSIADNSARERAERAELFVQELTHRAKNMFTVLLAISSQIGKASNDVGSFQSAFEQRLRSFAATYRVFERGDGRGASINDLVRSQLSLFNGGDIPQIRVEGPNLRLPAGPTEYLGLAIHELATNAVKYGALSVKDGEVEIRWAADAGDQLFQFDWIERRGAPVSLPTSKGFGSVILKKVVPSAFGGVATLHGSPEGVIWHLEAPLTVMFQGTGQALMQVAHAA
jgi:PAS domain S-box-containing protein